MKEIHFKPSTEAAWTAVRGNTLITLSLGLNFQTYYSSSFWSY